MWMKSVISAALAGTAALAAGDASAQGLPDNVLTAELREGWRQDSGRQMTALRLTLAPGWKTYWRAPGDAGIPPSFDWTGSRNVAGVSYHWPKPDVFDINGLRVIGYRDELVLPVEFTATDPGKPMAVSGRIDLGVCDEICVPMTVSVTQAFSGSTAPDPVIQSALAAMPEATKSTARCEAEPIRDGLRMTARVPIPRVGPDEFAVIELADRNVWISPADTSRDGGELRAIADMVPPNAQPFALDRSGVRITIFGGSGRVVDVQGCAG